MRLSLVAGFMVLVLLLIAGFHSGSLGADPSDLAWGVPEFNPQMLVRDGEAAAKLVVGTMNPDSTGLEEDSRSAGLIAEAVAGSFNTTVGGEIAHFTYGEEDLDGDLDTAVASSNVGDDFYRTETLPDGGGFRGDDFDDKWLVTDLSNFGAMGVVLLSGDWLIGVNKSSNAGGYGLWVDDDGSEKIDKDLDWPLYNDLKILDWTRDSVLIMPSLRIGRLSSLMGQVVKIHGTSYAVTKYEAGSVELTQVFENTLISAGAIQDTLDTALLIPETPYRIGLKGLATSGLGVQGDFVIIIEGSITDSSHRGPDTQPPLEVGVDLELTPDLVVIPTDINAGSGYLNLAIGGAEDRIDIMDEERGVFGYSIVRVGDSSSGWPDELRFEDDPLLVSKGGFKRLGDSENFFLYTDKREIDIWRRKPTSVHLDEEEDIPLELATLKDKDVGENDKTDFNLILIGGPVANNLTADLVNMGQSRVQWDESEGDMEILDGPYHYGRYVVIVAGKDRWATKKAVEALAAMI